MMIRGFGNMPSQFSVYSLRRSPSKDRHPPNCGRDGTMPITHHTTLPPLPVISVIFKMPKPPFQLELRSSEKKLLAGFVCPKKNEMLVLRKVYNEDFRPTAYPLHERCIPLFLTR